MIIKRTIQSATYLLVAVTMLVNCQFALSDKPDSIDVKLDKETGQYLFTEGQARVLQYNYATVEIPKGYLKTTKRKGVSKYAVPRSDYIHPLYGMDGEELTRDWPERHPHHRGIYWAWPEVQNNGETGDLHALQLVFARPTGKVELKHKPKYAELKAENQWLWNDKTPVVDETATIRVWKSSDNGRYIDLELTFKPLAEGITLARRHKNTYGGLNIRLSPVEKLRLHHYVSKDDTEVRPAWQFASGIWEGGKRPTVFAVFEKTDNPDYPGDFVEYEKLPWFQPAFPRSDTRFTLDKDKPLTLQYRIWLTTSTGLTQEDFLREWKIYQTTSTK